MRLEKNGAAWLICTAVGFPIAYKAIPVATEARRHSKNHHIYASDWDQLQPCHIFFMAIFTLPGFGDFPDYLAHES